MRSGWRVIAAAVIVVLAVSTVALYVEASRLRRLHESAHYAAWSEARLAMSGVVGHLYLLRLQAGRNEATAVYIMLYNLRDYSMISSEYFRLLAVETGDDRYSTAAARLDELAVWAQNLAQRMMDEPGGAEEVMRVLNQTPEILEVREAVRDARDYMLRARGDPPPELAARIAEAVDGLLEATGW